MAPKPLKNMVIAISGTFPGYKQGKESIADPGEINPSPRGSGDEADPCLLFSLQPTSRFLSRSKVLCLALRLLIGVPI
jgi:hypothetical protein